MITLSLFLFTILSNEQQMQVKILILETTTNTYYN
jgi:hypothetical protein